jgi:hypothetical protein
MYETYNREKIVNPAVRGAEISCLSNYSLKQLNKLYYVLLFCGEGQMRAQICPAQRKAVRIPCSEQTAP